MSHSLKQRFNGNSEEVVKYARQFGIWSTMEQYQVKDYVAMFNFLKEQAPGESFTTQVAVTEYAGPDAFDKLCEAITRKMFTMESKIQTLVAENIELKRQVDAFKEKRWERTRQVIQGMLEYCEESK